LAGFLARRLARQGSAVFLMVAVAPFRRKFLAAMPAVALLLSPHLVSSPYASTTGVLHESRRKPKNIQTAKNIQPFYSTSRRISSFTSASYDQFQVGRDSGGEVEVLGGTPHG
jgi:hypothetical protein